MRVDSSRARSVLSPCLSRPTAGGNEAGAVEVGEGTGEGGVMSGVQTRLDGATLVVRIPMRLQHRGSRKRIVAPDGSAIVPAFKPQPDGTLVKALARAWRWQRMLDVGVYATVSDIGDAENISKSYVSRILRLALLAPDIGGGGPRGADQSSADAGDAGAAAAGKLGGAA